MDDINFGHILVWIFSALLLFGYIAWHQAHDIRTKMRAKRLKASKQAVSIKIIELKMGRYGVDAFVFEYEEEENATAQEQFIPRTFFAELGGILVEKDDKAKLYTAAIKPGEAAWLELRDNSFWGYLGPRIY